MVSPPALSHWVTCDAFSVAVPPELGAVGREEARQIALLDLAVALHPVLGEDLVLGFVWLMLSPLDSARCESNSRAAFATAEGAEAPDEAGRLRAQRARERVRLVEDQVVEPRAGEQLDVLLPGQEQFELLDVGEQDAWLPARCAHDLPGADLLPRIHRLTTAFAPRPCEPGFVVGLRRPRSQPDAHHVRLPLRGLADVDPERYSRASQHPAQPHELVFGERVHRIDDDGADAGRCLLVPEREAPADDGVEEAFGLAGPGAGEDECRVALGNRADCAFLVAVEVCDLPRDPLAQMRMKQPFGDQRSHRRALPERPRKADVRPLEQWRLSSFVEGDEVPASARSGAGRRRGTS